MITAASLPCSLSFTLIFVSSGEVLFWRPSFFWGHSSVCFFMTKFLRVKTFSSRVIFLMSWRKPLPSILTCMLDIPSLVLSNMCLANNFSRWDGSVFCGCLEVDKSMPSIDSVLNSVSAVKWICQKCCNGSSNYSFKFMWCILLSCFALVISYSWNSKYLTVWNEYGILFSIGCQQSKGNIYVKNLVTVGHIFCCMLLLCKHKDTFVGFTHCWNWNKVLWDAKNPKQVPHRILLNWCRVFHLLVCCLSSEVVVAHCAEWRLAISSCSILVCQVGFCNIDLIIPTIQSCEVC